MVSEHRARIFLSPPDVGLTELDAVTRAVKSGWVAPVGPDLNLFEQEIAEQVGVAFGVAMNSGTAALHVGLLASGVNPGDSVVTSSATFVATANAITYCSALPVFVDCLPDGTANPGLIEEAIIKEKKAGRRVGAVVPVDLYGRMCDYDAILPICEQYDIPVVVDAAEALGAERQNLKAGSVGLASVVSFNGNKVMTTSGGGMLLTSSAKVADYARFLGSHAKEKQPHYEHKEVGFNYRLSNVAAALGRAQLVRLMAMIEPRRARRRQYEQFFNGVEGVTLLPGDSDKDNCWLTAVLVDQKATGWTPTELRDFLEGLDIESRLLWKPMHLQPVYRGATYFGERVAEDLFENGLALPSGSAMTDTEMGRVLDGITKFVGQQ